MIHTREHGKLTWIDLENPTREEVRELMDKYSLHPLTGEELLMPTLKPKVDVFPSYIYLILHFPAFRHSHKSGVEQEVDFIIGKNFLVTTRYDTIDPMHKFSKVFEVNSILDRSDFGEHAGFIFFYMIRKLYSSLSHELDFISDSLRAIEGRVFSGNEREMVFEISKLSRELLHFKKSLSAHREVLESFGNAAHRFFGESFSYHAKDIIGAYFRTAEMISGNIEFLNELRETNNSLLSTKQNETMRVLAIISFVTFPLTLVAAIFSMDAIYTPIVGRENDFWIIMSIMAGIAFCFFIFFKSKKWL